MAKYTNTLTSHHGESGTRAINKMGANRISVLKGKSKRNLKYWSKKKNRQIIKNTNNDEKLGFMILDVYSYD